MSKVQVCDFSKVNFHQQFIGSIRNTGFAVISNHGIDHNLIRQVQMDWKLFFLDDPKYKESFINREDPNLGYHGYKKEQAVGAKVPDLKEFFHWIPWRADSKIPSITANSTQDLYVQLEDIGLELLNTLTKYQASHHNMPIRDYFSHCENSDKTLLRALYYPAVDLSREPGAVRAAAHEDINYITLLVAASSPGLEAKDNEGNWHAIPHEENSIVVNIGDMMQLASKGFYKSTTHRVVNPDNSNSDRISIPLFIHPHTDTVLDLDTGFTAGQYLNQRINQIYGDRK